MMLGLVNQRKALQKKLSPEKKPFGDSAADKAEQERDRVAVPPEWADFEYFATQTKARTSTGVRKIELFEWQKELARLADKENVIVTKSRQTGASQWLIMYVLHFALVNPGSMVLIVSKSFGDAGLLTRRMRRAITGLNHPCANPLSDSLSLVHFPNDSQIMFKSASPPEVTGRGVDSIDVLVCDEASWCADLGTALGTLGPALSASATARMILISTPNGRNGVYWEKLVDGIGPNGIEQAFSKAKDRDGPGFITVKPEKGMAKFIVHWSAIPRYRDEDDFLGRMQREFAITDATIEREFQLNFEESAQTIFDWATVQNCLRPPISSKDEPKPDCVYWGSIDPCGMGQDYCVAMVLQEDKDGICEVVALYRSRTGTTAQHLSGAMRMFKKWRVAEVAIETNAMGQSWLEQFSEDKSAPRVVGVATTASSKPVMVGRLVMAFESGRLLIPEGSAVHGEVLSYQQIGRTMRGAAGCHDDCVSGLFLAAHISGLNAGIERFSGSVQEVEEEDFIGMLDLG